MRFALLHSKNGNWFPLNGAQGKRKLQWDHLGESSLKIQTMQGNSIDRGLGGLLSLGLQRFRQDWESNTFTFRGPYTPQNCAWNGYMHNWPNRRQSTSMKERPFQCGLTSAFTPESETLLTLGKLFIWVCLSLLICEMDIIVPSLEVVVRIKWDNMCEEPTTVPDIW